VWREFYEHFAMILIPVSTPQGVVVNETTDKFHRTMMAKAELLRECRNSRTSSLGQALHSQKKLVLLGFDAFRTSRFLTKVQELPDTAPKLSKLAKACF
jgi:hypothetical protein